MSALAIKYADTGTLNPNPRNSRTHSAKQIQQIARSIQSYGFNNPILVDAEGTVVAGHGRLEAAMKLGMAKVPTICLDHLSDAQRRAYIIADNRLAELAGWDEEILRIEFQELITMDLGFDVTDLGFEMAEIDSILGEVELGEMEDECRLSSAEEVVPVSRAGDLWQLGDHLLFCGDALDEDSYRILLGGAQAQMVFTDPPYNVRVDGHVSGLGKAKHREFVQASGEMSRAGFVEFLETACASMAKASTNGSIHFICMDWRHIAELVEAGTQAYSELKNICVWVKNNGGMGSLYRSQHELVAVFKSGNSPHRNNVQLGKHGRYRTNIWEYDGMNSFQSGRDDKLAMHPTVKPTALVADAILDCSNRKDIVLDPFAGSGTTILAAERTGRLARCIELDPQYVDVALHRFWTLTGERARNLWTGKYYGPQRSQPHTDQKSSTAILEAADERRG